MKPIPTIVSAAISSNIFLGTAALAMFQGRPVLGAICVVLGLFLLTFTITPMSRPTK